MINLEGITPFAKGGNRKCFVHPDNPNRCLKVVHAGLLEKIKKNKPRYKKLRSEDTFDHKVVLDEDDPNLHHFHVLEDAGLCQITILDGVGAEMFAKHAYDFADKLIREQTDNRCWVHSVECMEHGANSAVFKSI